MNKINKALTEFKEMDELAAGKSPVHRLNPLVKFLITIAYIIVLVSFNKYDLSGMLILALYPILIFQVSGIPMGTCFYKLRIVLPLVCAVGLFNPFFDKEMLIQIGNISVSGGVVSMITLMLKGILCLMASFILVATTPVDKLCVALRKLHVPAFLVTLLLLTYRYIAVMMEELSIMTDAYHLRAPDQKGIHHKAWGSFLGQLLLRSMDKSEELYQAMQLRGFDGNFRYMPPEKCSGGSIVFFVVTLGLFILCRIYNIAALMGGLFT